jgi:hypothetical protein
MALKKKKLYEKQSNDIDNSNQISNALSMDMTTPFDELNNIKVPSILNNSKQLHKNYDCWDTGVNDMVINKINYLSYFFSIKNFISEINPFFFK